ncbi:sulfatase [Halomarina ordinaria]|uniref:Sulfatase n=1 Tax=Halomarina ordinaria TaxID=3033939 RepID=A0ABD5U9I8_9EURY|nr:sulfatase [Halomarina sp. PSRA2]
MTDILLLTVDSLRADHVGCYGYDRETTPTIDALADEGCRFENAFAHACSTRPSFPSILASSYALMYGGYERISDEQTLVSEALSDAGYRTAGLHSNLYLSADFGYGSGFDHFFDSKTDPGPVARIKQIAKDRLDNDGLLFQALSTGVNTAERQAGLNVGSAYVTADDLTDMAVDWVDEQATASDPRFLWAHYMDVHHPYVPPERHQRALTGEYIDERQAVKLRRKMLEEPEALSEHERQQLLDLYDAEIRFCDAEIGRLLQHVRETWGEDTVVLFTADHGEEFGEHGQYSHHATFFDEVTHVPFVLSDGEASGEFEDLVGLLDVTPTLVDYAGGEQADAFWGHSLRSLVGAGEWPRDSVIGDWAPDGPDSERRYAYRDHDWKYIRRGQDEELYDLRADPGETEDVAGEERSALERCRAAVDDHERDVDATTVDLGDVEMEDHVKQRLRDLGYQE